MKLVGAHEDIRVLNNLHQALLSKHSKDFVVFLNKQGVSIEEANILVFLLKSIAFEVNPNELSLLSGTLAHERKYGSYWSNIEKMGVLAGSLNCDSKLAENITDVMSKSERIEKSDKSNKSNIEDFFKQLNLAKPPKNDIKVFSEEKDDKKKEKESVYDFLEKVCKDEYTDEKELRDAHKRAMSTQNGKSMFSMFKEQSTQTKEYVDSKQEENQGQANKIHLTYVPPVFNEMSKDKAVAEDLRYIKIKEKVDKLNEEDPVKSIYMTTSHSENSLEKESNIKKVIDILELNGFDCLPQNYINSSDGSCSTCDILAQKNGNKFRIEVDDGMDSVKNYFEKFEKILIADNWLIFITPNKKGKKRLKEIFKEFVKQRIVDGLIGLKKANKKYIFLSIPELQSLPNKFYDKLVGKE